MCTNNFINKAKKIHGDRYDYSLVNYINARTKIKIKCFEHGIFEQQPRAHLVGQNCPNCNKYNTKTLINKLKETHGENYDYSLVEYNTYKDKIKIICPIHGEFEQKPSNHIQGHGCVKCCILNKTEKLKKDVDIFINESKLKHKNKYVYSLVEYVNNRTKIKIICPTHGVFEQRPDSHLSGSGCPICNESKGEKKIGEFLIEQNIKFIKEKKFINCRNIRTLPFDFYLPDYNICIEYDGIQHFKPVKRWGGLVGLIEQQINDKIKTDFCLNNNIILKRIKYNEKIKIKLDEIYDYICMLK